MKFIYMMPCGCNNLKLISSCFGVLDYLYLADYAVFCFAWKINLFLVVSWLWDAIIVIGTASTNQIDASIPILCQMLTRKKSSLWHHIFMKYVFMQLRWEDVQNIYVNVLFSFSSLNSKDAIVSFPFMTLKMIGSRSLIILFLWIHYFSLLTCHL